MQKLRSVRLSVLVATLLALGLAACSKTWEGAKEDTRENVKTTGQGLEKAGENIQKQTQ
jgi:predicted small secreted protein